MYKLFARFMARLYRRAEKSHRSNASAQALAVFMAHSRGDVEAAYAFDRELERARHKARRARYAAVTWEAEARS